MKRDNPYKYKSGLSIANEPSDNLILTVNARQYPDMNFIYNTLIQKLNIQNYNIIIGNGIENVLKNVLLGLKPKQLTWFYPTWGFIDVYCKQLNIITNKYKFIFRNNYFYEKNIKSNIDTYYTTFTINNFFNHTININNIKKSKICILDASYINIINCQQNIKNLINNICNNKYYCKNTILLGSFDKIYGAGLRLGFAIFPKNLSKKILLQREIFINCAAAQFINNKNFLEPTNYFYKKIKSLNFNKIKLTYLFICKNFITLCFNKEQKFQIQHKKQLIKKMYLYRFGIPNSIIEFNKLIIEFNKKQLFVN